MKILVACEESQAVTIELRKLGQMRQERTVYGRERLLLNGKNGRC